MNAPSHWRSAPRRSRIIFLLAVFFVFASLGFATDSMNMGTQPRIRFAVSIVLSGLFPALYAATGMVLRGKFWKVAVPLFIVQFFIMRWLENRFPGVPQPAQFNAPETLLLHNRLVFDGCAVMISVCLGYVGFVWVTISEGRRYIRTQTEKALLESEIAAAREVQRVMVPEDLPSIPGYVIESVYRPAAEVGGDFFQIIPLKSGYTLVVIGDVSGKGLGAAMVVSLIVGMLRAITGFTEEPAGILSELNGRLCGRTHEGFVTCLAVRLESPGSLTLANAGHLPPYLNGMEVPFEGSIPLGLIETAAYEQTRLEMHGGDVLMLLTDGVAEAQNKQRELLGFNAVESLLRKGASARIVADTAQQHGQNDDLTVISLACQA